MRTATYLIASVFLVGSLAPSLQAATSPVGASAGQFEVNANGAATYTVPIQVPPGVNGIEPKLALVYNSQQGNGLLGVGWSLSGLSTVNRCPASIAVDGARSGINFSGSQFCWNGQRLIAKTSGGSQETGTDAFGAYWEFRTELESFARVRAYTSATNPSFFKIWTQDGRLLSFGATADANVNPQGKGTLIWALNREEDRKGNYLSVSYGTTADDSEYYPSTIQYGGVTGTAARSVVFGMDASARADTSTKYVSGAKIVSTKRLKTITAKFGANTVRSYTLAYTADATAASRSLLQSVQECGADNTCYTNKLVFAHASAGTAGYTNGGGVNLTGGTELNQWNQLADVNGDGLMDVFKVTDAASGRVAVNLGLPGGGFGGDVATTGVITNETTPGSGFNQWNELADMNGDGIMDIFRVMPPASGTLADARVYLGDTNGSGGFSTTPITLSSAVTYGAQGFRFWNQLIDMNADGLADIFRVLPNTQKFTVNYGYWQAGTYKLETCMDADPSCWINGLAISNNSHGFRQNNQLADMNGDGLIDLFKVLIPNNGADPGNARNVSILFARSMANTIVPGGKLAFSTLAADQNNVVTPIIFSNAKYGGYFNFYNQLVDVNGDGLPDIVKSRPVLDQSGTPVKVKKLDVLVAKRDVQASSQSLPATEKPDTSQICGHENDKSYAPCSVYLGFSYRVQFQPSVTIHLNKGDGSFGSAVSTAVIINQAGLEIPSSNINAINFVNDVTIGTSYYTCSISNQLRVRDPSLISNSGFPVSDNYQIRVCDTALEGGDTHKGLSGISQFADVDSDNYIDIISADVAGALKVAYGNGDGSFKVNPETNEPYPLGVAINVAKGFRAHSQLADMNGDGMVDIFTMSGTTGTPKISGRKPPGLLASITDGNNLLTSITYQPLSNSSAYTRSAGVDAYPLRKLSTPQSVVSSSTVSAPGFSYDYSYKYSDARVDLSRGWLGFASMTRTDTNAALETATNFNQAFPYAGRPSQQTVRHTSAAAGKFLSKTTYTWANRADTGVNTAGKVHFVHQTGSVQTSYEPNTNYSTVLTSTSSYLNNPVAGNYDATPYDQYGHPEKVQVAHSDGHTLITTYASSYAVAPSTLHLGQVSQRETTVAHTAPGPAAETRSRVSRDSYDADGLLQTTVTQPNTGDANTELKLTASYTYDANGRLASLSTAGADPSYNASGAVAANPSVTRQVNYAYGAENATANSLSVTTTTAVSGASNHSETLTYDPRYGAQTAHTDPAGITTAWGYDGFGRKVSEQGYSGSARPVTTSTSLSAAGATGCPALTGLSYCATSTQSGVSTTLSSVTAQYDALGRELRVISKDAASNAVYTDTQYNSAGKPWRLSRPYYATAAPQWMATSYDLAQRPYQVTQPNGATSTTNYQGLISTVTLAASGDNSRSTTTVKNSQGDITKVIDALGYSTAYAYGAFGMLKSVTDAKGNIISNGYDIFGNKTTLTDPDLGTWQFRYNAFGELKWQKDAKDQITSLSYDLRGRSTSRTEQGGVTNTWTYDTPAAGQGRLDNSTRNGITQSYAYDPVTGQTRSASLTLNSTVYSAITDYDDLGRVQFISYPAAALKVKYGYHPNGALNDIVDAATAALYWKASEYNADGLPVAESWGNGINGTRSYNPATGALTGIVSGSVQNLSYSYYNLGNLQSRSNKLPGISVTETFYYDALNRLKRVSTNTGGIKNFDYDALGNLSFKSGVGHYSYGARPHAVTQVTPGSADLSGDADGNGSLSSADGNLLVQHILGAQTASGKPDCDNNSAVNILDVLCLNNRLLNQSATGSASYSYTYDNNGNMESGGGRSIAYTAFNMPLTVDYNGQRETYAYGPDYSRVSKEIKTISTGAVSETTTYLGKLYERIDRGGAVEERFYISAGDRLVAQLNKTGTTATVYYIHTDMLGSVETVTNAAKTPVNNLSFDAFGQARKDTWQDGAPSAAFSKTTRGYTGHETDTVTGLVNMNARLYDPWLGRFLQADTLIPDVFQPQSINPYSYVMNNPFRYTDPSGHEFIGTSGNLTFFNDGYTGKPYAVYDASLGQYDFIDGSTIGIPGGFTNSATAYGQDVFAAQWANCVGLGCGSVNKISFDAHMPANERAAFMAAGIESQSGCGGRANACHGTAYIYQAEAPSREPGLQNVADWFMPPPLKTTGALIGGGVGVLRRFGDDAAGAVTKGLADTNTIRFTQDTAGKVVNGKASFSDGVPISRMINDLKSGVLNPADVKPIRTFVRDGKTYTLDNRRLLAHDLAGVKVNTRPATEAELSKELGSKFSTRNDGTIIGIRGSLE